MKSIVEGVLGETLNFKYKERYSPCPNKWYIDDWTGGEQVGEGGGTALFSHGADEYYHNIMEGEVNPEQGEPGQEDRHFTIESCNPLMSFTNNTGIV